MFSYLPKLLSIFVILATISVFYTPATYVFLEQTVLTLPTTVNSIFTMPVLNTNVTFYNRDSILFLRNHQHHSLSPVLLNHLVTTGIFYDKTTRSELTSTRNRKKRYRGTRAGNRKRRNVINRSCIPPSTRPLPLRPPSTPIEIKSNLPTDISTHNFKMVLLNARSVANKANLIYHYLIDNNIDVCNSSRFK